MVKAVYLLLVYLLPLLSLLIPIEHFQSIWLWVYLPVGACYFVFVWVRPYSEMMMWVTLTPVVTFMSFEVVSILWCLLEASAGNELLTVLLIITLYAFMGAVVIGSGYLLLAYGLFALFRGNHWFKADTATGST